MSWTGGDFDQHTITAAITAVVKILPNLGCQTSNSHLNYSQNMPDYEITEPIDFANVIEYALIPRLETQRLILRAPFAKQTRCLRRDVC